MIPQRPNRTNPDARFFDERPIRTAQCQCCRGTGAVFDAYALSPAPGAVIDAPNNAIRAMANGAFDIFTACREAAEIALRAHQSVAFEFLDHTVVVRPHDDPERVAHDWWVKQYSAR